MFREGFTDDTMLETQKLNSSIRWAYTFEASQHACNSILVPHWHYRFSQGEHSEAMEDARCVLEMKAKKL